jgi:TM2 domain-containing membrane protein YozV
MRTIDSIYTANMTPEQRSWFYAEYRRASKDEVIGVLLALFLGSFGIHHFYLRRDGAGILYLLFSWTGIPAILGFVECFFMPSRVRHYNAVQAAFISSQILASSTQPVTSSSPLTPHCPTCSNSIDPAATFCTHCGSPVQPGFAIQPAI